MQPSASLPRAQSLYLQQCLGLLLEHDPCICSSAWDCSWSTIPVSAAVLGTALGARSLYLQQCLGLLLEHDPCICSSAWDCSWSTIPVSAAVLGTALGARSLCLQQCLGLLLEHDPCICSDCSFFTLPCAQGFLFNFFNYESYKKLI